MLVKSFFSKGAPLEVKKKIRFFIGSIELLLLQVFSKNRFLASIYYVFVSTEFYREHRALLLARIAYNRALTSVAESNALLRRNIHRLEKGLIMQPRRKIFAEDYISETVNCFAQCQNHDLPYSDEYRWANDVLESYFSIVGASQVIDKEKIIFNNLKIKNQSIKYIPYPHSDLPQCPISYTDLLTLFQRRRSVRWYKNESIDMQLIQQAVQAATLAPSACNRQPYRFHILNDAEKAAEIASCAMGTAGFSNNLTCLIAIVGDLSAYPEERDRHIIYIDSSLAAMQMMLAFETLGLSTCSINWPDIESREKVLSTKLGLAYYERVVMLLAVGYAEPNGGIPYSQKKSSKLLMR